MMNRALTRHAVLIADPQWESYGDAREATKDLAVDLFWALTAQEAFEILAETPIRLLLIDGEMRTDDGRLLALAIKEEPAWRGLYTVGLVKPEYDRASMSALEVLLDEFLAKPVNPLILRARIRTALRMQRLIEEEQRLERWEALMATIVTIGHRINNPLCAISGNAMLLREEIDALPQHLVGDEIRECLDTIESQTHAIADVVRRLQELDEPRLGKYLGQTRMVMLAPERVVEHALHAPEKLPDKQS